MNRPSDSELLKGMGFRPHALHSGMLDSAADAVSGVLARSSVVAPSEEGIPSLPFKPQPGPQEDFLESDADIVIAGGAAGGGKTWALLRQPLDHMDNPHFGAVIFRRTYPQITNEGGLWDEAEAMYPSVGGTGTKGHLTYEFPSGMAVRFAHLQHDKDRLSWKGAQIPMLGFDQLEDFSEKQFWFLLSRNRSARVGLRPYVRATCNPVPPDDPVGGWLNRLISWWIDPDTGYAIEERAGMKRWFVRIAEEIHWADSPEDFAELFPDIDTDAIRPKSLTFIPAKLEDNPILEKADPDYRGKLMALPAVERERLLAGNWIVKEAAGLVFNRGWFQRKFSEVPSGVTQWIRYWDKAGTEGGGAYSAGVLIGKLPVNGDRNGDGEPEEKDVLPEGDWYVVADVQRGQWSQHQRETTIQQVADSDAKRFGMGVQIWLEQEPADAGKESAQATIRRLARYNARAHPATGSKLVRAGPFSAQAEAGNVILIDGDWNEAFLSELQNFDGVKGFMDQVDAACGAYNKLVAGPRPVKKRKANWG